MMESLAMEVMCFPKDVNALLSSSKTYDLEMNTILGGWKTNIKVRSDKDWEKEGRSVSYKKQNKHGYRLSKDK